MAKNDPYASLSEYLPAALEKSKHTSMHGATAVGCFAGVVGIGIATFFLNQIMSTFLAMGIGLFIGLPVLIALVVMVENRLSTPKTDADRRTLAAHEATKLYKSVLDRKRLTRELDPVVGQLLEASAFHYQRAKVSLESSVWSEAAGGSQRAALKTQIVQAMDSAMEEALILGKDCLGKPGKDDWKDKLEDAFDLDVIDTIQSLTGFKLSESKRNTHRSPHARVVFEPMREIAEKLKLLASEVERMTREFAISTPITGSLGAPAASLDMVLHELRSVQEAERELNQRQGL